MCKDLSAYRRVRLLAQFHRNERGNYLVMTALLSPVLIGVVGLGSDYGLWNYTHQKMQSATDSGAMSAATAYTLGNSNLSVQANAVASSYGFVNGANTVV